MSRQDVGGSDALDGFLPQDHATRAAWLLDAVRRLAAQAGIPAPPVGIEDSEIPSAVAQHDGAIRMSSALFGILTAGELEVTLSHELGHIVDGKKGPWPGRGARLLDWICPDEQAATWRVIAAGLITLILAHFSQRRERRADAFSARLVGVERAIASLERMGEINPLPVPDDPRIAWLRRRMCSHPTHDERIAALRKMALR